jgi:hypothetical protein
LFGAWRRFAVLPEKKWLSRPVVFRVNIIVILFLFLIDMCFSSGVHTHNHHAYIQSSISTLMLLISHVIISSTIDRGLMRADMAVPSVCVLPMVQNSR